MSQPERKILAQFDSDGNGRLEGREIDAAREALKKDGAGDRRGPEGGDGPRGRGRPGGPGGFRPGGMGPPGMGDREPGKPGPKVAPADVAPAAGAGLFDPSVVRTVFLDFDLADWESDLELFHNTDVDLPARMTVDGKRYDGVGVRFRGASSYFMVPKGSKRSLNVSVDHSGTDLRLLGQNTLNLLNSNGDPSFLSSHLYSRLAAPHIAAPRANWVRVVINGESWGLYVNVEQFNKAFLKDRWPQFKGDGARWKVVGSPNGSGGLDDRGDDLAAYRARYEIKSKDRPEDWARLVALCKTLSNTPIDGLEAALRPMLDIDGALWFLALDVCTGNSDGYWTRASDYSLYLDPEGRFHVVPHDMNECFKTRMEGPPGGFGPRGPRRPGGPDGPTGQGGARGGAGGPAVAGPRGRGSMAELDPLVGLDDPTKPLRSRLLAVPSLRAAYLERVRTLADEMSWERTGPAIEAARAMLEPFVEADTRKLSSLEGFRNFTSPDPVAPDVTEGPRASSLRAFLDRRCAFLRRAASGAMAPGNASAPSAGPAGKGRE